MKRIFLFVLLSSLSSCSHASWQGPCIHYIECPDGMEYCHQQVQSTCPAGFNLLEESITQTSYPSYAGGAEPGPHMIVTCNP